MHVYFQVSKGDLNAPSISNPFLNIFLRSEGIIRGEIRVHLAMYIAGRLFDTRGRIKIILRVT